MATRLTLAVLSTITEAPPNNSGVATLTIVNSTISGNTANVIGGAIYNIGSGTGNGGTVNLTNSTLSGNNSAGPVEVCSLMAQWARRR